MIYPIVIFICFASSIYLMISALIPSDEDRVPITSGVSFKQTPLVFRIFKSISSVLNKPFSKLPFIRSFNEKTEFLGLPFGGIEFLLMKELSAVGFWLAARAFFPEFTVQLIAILVGFVLPDFFLIRKVAARRDAIVRAFPETVDLLDLCISAGLDFLSAVRWIIEKTTGNPFVYELSLVFNEIRVGRPQSEALKAMALRLKIPDVRSFVRTIVQSSRMGVSVEEALSNLSEDTRDMRFQRGERFAIKAALKLLIPLLLCILPVILVIVAGPVIIKFTTGGLIPSGGSSLLK